MSKKKKNRKGRKAKDREERDYQAPASSVQGVSIPLLPQEDMASRFIQLLERQMQAKDEQIRMLDARLQDAFDMQRALALIVREFEQRTGISSDVVWDQVPEEDLTREHHPKQEAKGEEEGRLLPKIKCVQLLGARTQSKMEQE